MKKIKNKTLSFKEVWEFTEWTTAETLEQLIKGFPPIPVYIHEDKILGEYFRTIYYGLIEKGVSLEVENLLPVPTKEASKMSIEFTSLMPSDKFFNAVKKLGLDLETAHKLSIVASKIYETEFPVVRVDGSIDFGELDEYLDDWMVG